MVEEEGLEDEGAEEGTEVVMSVPIPAVPTPKDKPLSRSLDLISDPIFSLLNTPHIDLNQARDWYNNGYRSPNAKPWPLSPMTKSLIYGY